jgi:hypothetical protein
MKLCDGYRWRAGSSLLAVAWLGLGLGCGDREEAKPSGPAMRAPVEEVEEGVGNRPPEIQGIRLEPRDPVPGGSVRAQVSVRDPDGDRVELGFVWSINGSRVPGNGSQIVLPHVRKGDEIEVLVTARDGQAESEPAGSTTTVANRRPTLKNVRLQPFDEVARGTSIVAAPEASDPDGDSLIYTYEWRVNDRPVSENGPSLSTAALRQGDGIQVHVTASDGESESDRVESAKVRVANAHPEILSQPSSVLSDGVFRYAVEARDPDGDRRLRYSLRTGPDGMKINPVLGEVTWAPRPDQAGNHDVEVVVEDSGGARTIQAFDLVVAEAVTDSLPPASLE